MVHFTHKNSDSLVFVNGVKWEQKEDTKQEKTVVCIWEEMGGGLV